MRKTLLLAAMACMSLASAHAESVVPLAFGNFDQWITRHIKESAIIGGAEKKLFEVGPTRAISGNKAYSNMGGSPWATSNVYAKVAGVVKGSNQVYPDRHGNGYCAKLTTQYEHVKALGIINMDVLASGTMFLGQMIEPVSSTKNPYSKMNMGVPFTKRPTALQFEYKLTVPKGQRIYSSGFGSKKNLPGQDYAEVFILLQRRWEDSKGIIHAARVGTGRQRFGSSVPNWTKHRIPIWYGDITHHAGYQSYMGLIPQEKNYYAKNSKGKLVPIIEEEWDNANATPTHMVIMISSGCGTAYTGTPGMALWVDNVALVY
jgi:hypothetical protein